VHSQALYRIPLHPHQSLRLCSPPFLGVEGEDNPVAKRHEHRYKMSAEPESRPVDNGTDLDSKRDGSVGRDSKKNDSR
jgi:hypothetical protein